METLQQTVWYILRHTFYFTLTLTPVLLGLVVAVRWVARRRRLPLPFMKMKRTAPQVGLTTATIGTAAQILFLVLSHLGLSAPSCRLVGLALAGAAAGYLASRTVPYLCRWKGPLFGAMAGVIAAFLYQHLVIPSSITPPADGAARLGLAVLLAGALALAVTLPLPKLAPAATATVIPAVAQPVAAYAPPIEQPVIWNHESVSFGSTITPPNFRIRAQLPQRRGLLGLWRRR